MKIKKPAVFYDLNDFLKFVDDSQPLFIYGIGAVTPDTYIEIVVQGVTQDGIIIYYVQRAKELGHFTEDDIAKLRKELEEKGYIVCLGKYIEKPCQHIL